MRRREKRKIRKSQSLRRQAGVTFDKLVSQWFAFPYFSLLSPPHFPPSIFSLKYSSNRAQNAHNTQLQGELKVG